MNRDRDDYQLPLALHEAGVLDRLVTDFYAPDLARKWLPARLRKRHVDGLPSSLSSSTPLCFFGQSTAEFAHLPMQRLWPAIDAMLARKAGRLARREGSHLYCYSPYLPPERAIPRGTRRLIFEYHPLPGLLWSLLSEDHILYPEVRESHEAERAVLDQGSKSDTWKRADAITCASGVTRDSLIFAGCDPKKVSVIPYGFDSSHTDSVLSSDPEKPAQFLFVGQGVQRKGLHHLIRAWQALDLDHAHLTLVCYRIDPGIKDLIRSPTITLLGQQTDYQLDLLYKSADIFVMPSLIEGFGLVYLEALARGCHIIGTRNTGLPDLQLPSEAATILPAGDLAQLTASLKVARDRHSNGKHNRALISSAAQQWKWSNFRASVGEHARSFLEN